MLEAVRSAGLTEQTRIYQASTSELYGKVQEVPQTESTPFYPRSPYAVSKLFGFWAIKNYRSEQDLVTGCLLNWLHVAARHHGLDAGPLWFCCAEKHTICLPATAFFLTMSHQGEGSIL